MSRVIMRSEPITKSWIIVNFHLYGIHSLAQLFFALAVGAADEHEPSVVEGVNCL